MLPKMKKWGEIIFDVFLFGTSNFLLAIGAPKRQEAADKKLSKLQKLPRAEDIMKQFSSFTKTF